MGLHQTKKLLHSEGIKKTKKLLHSEGIKKTKKLPTEWEKMFANHVSDKG